MSHIGHPGERRDFDAQLVRVVTGHTFFNERPLRTLRFHQADGAVLMWRTSTRVLLVEGAFYQFKATVKAHRTGVPVCGQPDEWTEITRVTVSDTPVAPDAAD